MIIERRDPILDTAAFRVDALLFAHGNGCVPSWASGPTSVSALCSNARPETTSTSHLNAQRQIITEGRT